MPVTRDTSADARRVQVRALRRVGGPARLAMALRMSEESRSVTLAGIRHRHPDWTNADVHEELLRLLLGPNLASAVSERLRRAR